MALAEESGLRRRKESLRSGRERRLHVEELTLRRSSDCEGEILERHKATEIKSSSRKTKNEASNS